MGKLAVKKIPPDIAKDVRSIDQGAKDLDHPYYQVEQRKGTGKATCRQCDKPIKEGESTLYFHYAPDDNNEWIRTRGSIHAEDCSDGQNTWTKCPKCREQIERSKWPEHWADERKQRAAAKLSHCGQCDEDYEDEHIHKFEIHNDEKKTASPQVRRGPARKCVNCGEVLYKSGNSWYHPQIGDPRWNTDPICKDPKPAPEKKAQVMNPLKGIQKQRGNDTEMGLDPTATPGNQTSNGERNVGDGASEGQEPAMSSPDPLKQIQRKQVDQAAGKLQTGLSEFAGTRSVLVGSFRHTHQVVPSVTKVAKTMEERNWWTANENQHKQDMSAYNDRVEQHKVDLDKYNRGEEGPHHKWRVCQVCNGMGINAYGDQEDQHKCTSCKGSGIQETPRRIGPPHPPSLPRYPDPPDHSCPCTSCTDNVKDNAEWNNWGQLTKGKIPSIQRWPGMDKTHEKVYPDRVSTCMNCKGSGKPAQWQSDKDTDCYSCKGTGQNAVADKRNIFEHALSKYTGKKSMVGIDASTGVWEDKDHYHVRLHNTDILSHHKTKPEVSINWGHENQWDTVTTRDRTSSFLPDNVRVRREKVRPGSSTSDTNEIVVRTHSAAYAMEPGITINTETGKAVGEAHEYAQCKECSEIREPEEMPNHQRRHDMYRQRFEENPKRTCPDCRGTGSTDSWKETCKACKGASALPTGEACGACRGSGVTYHRGAEPKIEWSYDQETQRHQTKVVDPEKCGKCGGEGQLDKRRPAAL